MLDGREGIADASHASHAVRDYAKGHSGAITRISNASLCASSTKHKAIFLRGWAEIFTGWELGASC